MPKRVNSDSVEAQDLKKKRKIVSEKSANNKTGNVGKTLPENIKNDDKKKLNEDESSSQTSENEENDSYKYAPIITLSPTMKK